MKSTHFACVLSVLCLLHFSELTAAPPLSLDGKRVLFLGDSITHAGHYISMLEEEFLLQGKNDVEFINLGLPSETCSGLSEPDHPFPRPDVHERIDRALAKVKPDIVFACYGINDGIYYPFSQERFAKYQTGIHQIINKVNQAGAQLVLMTPPAFDPLPLKEKGKLLPAGAEKYAWFAIYENYDEVLKKYSEWLMSIDENVELVIDLHSPVNQYVDNKRLENPQFTMSPDGVHVNQEGHAVIADAIMNALAIPNQQFEDEQLSKLVHQKQTLLHNAWLSHVGHQRPGVKAGLPLDQAREQSAQLDQQIQERLVRVKPVVFHQQEQGRGSLHHLFYPASSKEDELSMAIDFYLWIPDDTEKLRGIIVHQHGCGDGAAKGGATSANDVHWQELAIKNHCALLGISYTWIEGSDCRAWCDPRNGSAARFEQALNDFATETSHPEVAEIPWCLWGHSGGGFWASIMQALYPERIAAIWLQSGQAYSRWSSGEIPKLEVPDSAYQIPVVACPGFKEKDHERFHVAWNGCFAMFQEYRKHNAPFIFAPDPRTGHECGDSRYLAIPFFDACLKLRLPQPGGIETELRKVKGFVAKLDGTSVQPINEYEGDLKDVVWLPTKEFAKPFQEFLKTGAVSDSSPPPAPKNVVIRKQADQYVVEWDVAADFESGIAAFELQQNGQTIARLPEKPVTRFGRSLFQKMSYHDTPEQPLPEMKFEFPAESLKSYSIEISSINSVGLKSKPTTIVLPAAAKE